VLWHEADYPATEKVGLYTYDVVSLRSNKTKPPPVLDQIVPYRRYGDVLAARKKEVDDRRRERLEGICGVMSMIKWTNIQGNQRDP
jgi:hypothetical protein